MDQGHLQETGDGFGQFARAIGLRGGEGESAGETLTGNAELMKEVGASAQCVLRKNGVTEAGFDEALDGFRVVRFHEDARLHGELLEEAINDETNVAALGIKEKRFIGKVGSAQRGDMAAADFVGGRADDEELFVEERYEPELIFRHGKRNEREIEAAIEKAGDHFFRDADGDTNLRVGIALAELAKRAAELIDERGHARGEVKGMRIVVEIVLKELLDLPHHADDLFGMVGEAVGGRSGNEALAAADKELGVEFVGEVVELKTDGAGRKVNFFGSASHAGRIHDREKKFELVNIHVAAPICSNRGPSSGAGGLNPESGTLMRAQGEGAEHFILTGSLGGKWLRKQPRISRVLFAGEDQ